MRILRKNIRLYQKFISRNFDFSNFFSDHFFYQNCKFISCEILKILGKSQIVSWYLTMQTSVLRTASLYLKIMTFSWLFFLRIASLVTASYWLWEFWKKKLDCEFMSHNSYFLFPQNCTFISLNFDFFLYLWLFFPQNYNFILQLHIINSEILRKKDLKFTSHNLSLYHGILPFSVFSQIFLNCK